MVEFDRRIDQLLCMYDKSVLYIRFDLFNCKCEDKNYNEIMIMCFVLNNYFLKLMMI